MKETLVVDIEVGHGRSGIMRIVDNIVMFDNSDEEYGIVQFDLQLLKDKIKEHEQK